ncbi:MAG: dihydrolipoyl dehydrogenase [Candidatus Obscuribacterales bacterium]|nr:dihydrolipoyl dehydrogenase [Candidatus Obscuribacterales bacterium]
MVMGEMAQNVDLVVIGAGPGGYTAALRAAELGIKTMLVDSREKPGGVCLHVGCIPSKALLHAAEVIDSSKAAAQFGITFQPPKIDINALRTWKQGVTDKLAQGIVGMCKSAGVEIVVGHAEFQDSKTLRVEQEHGSMRVNFKHAILATGSRPVVPKGLDLQSKRLMDSTSALAIEEIPKKLLIIGGGYIGLEMGTVYAALGAEVTVVEMMDGLLPGVDRDLVKPLAQHLQETFKAIYLNTKVAGIREEQDGIVASFEGKDVPATEKFDRVLVSVGRRPNSDNLGLETTQVKIDKHGFVEIDDQCKTADKRILAIGDVSGQPMLAHRAMRQGIVAAEVLAGRDTVFDNRCIPAIVFTEPEIAWVGITETEAKAQGVEVVAAKFPWSASGRAMTLGEPVGQTKIIYDPKTTLVLGVGIVGPRAGELISEAALAIEMGAVLEDLLVTIHPHPTLSETVNEAAIVANKRIERQSKTAAKV